MKPVILFTPTFRITPPSALRKQLPAREATVSFTGMSGAKEAGQTCSQAPVCSALDCRTAAVIHPELVTVRPHLLAVATPWGVELNKPSFL